MPHFPQGDAVPPCPQRQGETLVPKAARGTMLYLDVHDVARNLRPSSRKNDMSAPIRDEGRMTRKILFYTHAFSGGGAEIVFARLSRLFAEAGDEVIFAADHQGPTPPRDSAKLRHTLLPAGHLAATRALAHLLRRERFDASFSALGAQNVKHVAAALAAGRLKRCVLGYHGFAAAEPKRLAQVSYWGAPVLTRLAARAICVSDALLDDLRQRWHASRARTLRIYNPIEPAGPVRAPQRPTILACGRLVPLKRFDDLIRALPLVAPQETRLVIVGEGPERATLEALAAKLGLQHRVALPGQVDDLARRYAEASCLAVASETESFGLTVAEALSYGLPVVATRCGGPEEILEDGRFGTLVSVGDVAALAAALTRALAVPGDPEPRRARANLFAPATVHRAYADLIDSLA